MAQASVNGIEIAYEVEGSGPPLLLVMGLGGQLTDWPEAFVAQLAERFTVVRFDNRDAGLSTISSAPPPERSAFLKALFRPRSVDAPYRLADMADDAAALMRHLDLGPTHVVGMSMGGMIAQLLALDHGDRVASLCSIMSHTGNPRTGRPAPRIMRLLARRVEPSRESAVEASLAFFAEIGGRDWDRDEHRQRAEQSVARAFNPAGILRQSLAIATAPDRTGRLADVGAPTLVVHGLDDTLVVPSGGVATTKAIPGSRLLMFPAMGHDIPSTRHREIVDAIAANADRSSISV
ncbi:MAG: alpha/beta hydrolase [Actinomycetota bacterium]